MQPAELDAFVAEYAKLRRAHEQFADRLVDLVRTLTDDAGIRIHAMESRAKTLESFRDKVTRPGKSYTNPLKEIADLCGVRIIVYHPEEVQCVEKLLRAEFAVDESESGYTARRLAPHEFGYLSLHLVAGLSEGRRDLAEWKRFKNLRVEIQVRTVLQHAWAAISHALQYKHEREVPETLKRQLFRLSGLLELADEEFANITRQHAELAATVAAASTDTIQEQGINRVSLHRLVTGSAVLKDASEAAIDAGFLRDDDDDGYPDPPRSLSELAAVCALAGITSVGELEQVVDATRSQRAEYFRRLIRRAGEERKTEDGAPGPALTKSVLP